MDGLAPAQQRRVTDIIENGLCIGCGLCESIAGSERVSMTMMPQGRERPVMQQSLDPTTAEQIFAVCPGTRIEGLSADLIDHATTIDAIWGPYLTMVRGFAADPEVRFRGASGGVLSALAIYLLETQRVDFVLHVAALPDRPMRSKRHLSFNRAQVLEAAGSRYGPVAPLVDFHAALDRERPFAFIGKPCDVGAIRNLAQWDSRVDRYCQYLLTLVCGGVSELGKSQDVLDEFGLDEAELALFRYRGYGNPGPTRVETRDCRTFEKTYNDMWADESGWKLQFRCKICPDAIGESADIVATDVWPGGMPHGEDAGFNGMIVRTRNGLELLTSAVRDGALILDQDLTPRDMDDFQPHQVRKKQAVWARLVGLRHAGQLVPTIERLRIRDLARTVGLGANLAEARGTRQRAREGRTKEPPAEAE
jgi:coenzyme F420 hydrogenase subunit beta